MFVVNSGMFVVMCVIVNVSVFGGDVVCVMCVLMYLCVFFVYCLSVLSVDICCVCVVVF